MADGRHFENVKIAIYLQQSKIMGWNFVRCHSVPFCS